MSAIDVFAITDADLDEWAAAGLLPRTDLPTREECELAARIEAMPLPTKKRKPTPIWHCSRCGIDTTRRGLCIDCEDVLALEAS